MAHKAGDAQVRHCSATSGPGPQLQHSRQTGLPAGTAGWGGIAGQLTNPPEAIQTELPGVVHFSPHPTSPACLQAQQAAQHAGQPGCQAGPLPAAQGLHHHLHAEGHVCHRCRVEKGRKNNRAAMWISDVKVEEAARALGVLEQGLLARCLHPKPVCPAPTTPNPSQRRLDQHRPPGGLVKAKVSTLGAHLIGTLDCP